MCCAFAMVLIKNDFFLPGALTLGFTLKQLEPDIPAVCMVTPEISAAACEALACVFDRVHAVQGIHFHSGVSGGRQDRNLLLTRFAALLLPYKKLLLFDADILPLTGSRALFALPAPAGVLNENKAHLVPLDTNGQPVRTTDANGEWQWHKIYRDLPHGARIPAKITQRVKTDPQNMGVNAALWRLDPKRETYEALLQALQSEAVQTMLCRFPWPEMQLATLLWSGQWVNMDARWCSVSGLPNLQVLHNTHFAGLKPWAIRNKSLPRWARYPDFAAWYQAYAFCMYANPPLFKNSQLSRLLRFILQQKWLG